MGNELGWNCPQAWLEATCWNCLNLLLVYSTHFSLIFLFRLFPVKSNRGLLLLACPTFSLYFKCSCGYQAQLIGPFLERKKKERKKNTKKTENNIQRLPIRLSRSFFLLACHASLMRGSSWNNRKGSKYFHRNKKIAPKSRVPGRWWLSIY